MNLLKAADPIESRIRKYLRLKRRVYRSKVNLPGFILFTYIYNV